MSDCLVIIDVQRGFLTKDTDCVPARIRKLTEKRKFDHIVATRFINTVDTPHYRFTGWDGMMDSRSQELDGYVARISERVFDKSTNSCFTDDFVGFVGDKSINEIYFAGIDTDCCVLKSAYDCFDRGIRFAVLADCCKSTGGPELHEAACMLMRRNLGEGCIRNGITQTPPENKKEQP